uniref:Uncharacterized protein n=2 Tax=Palpitomonas bilix TaxID=652834 RepID=A0A7S3G127_9EUKA|mmetsp:Transcript_17210/g.42892  ORF Transcript_17210/g.42892 Transcript_17210/m.42892 type:complete len:267 (+) Transcript_17210:555-1355(+)
MIIAVTLSFPSFSSSTYRTSSFATAFADCPAMSKRLAICTASLFDISFHRPSHATMMNSSFGPAANLRRSGRLITPYFLSSKSPKARDTSSTPFILPFASILPPLFSILSLSFGFNALWSSESGSAKKPVLSSDGLALSRLHNTARASPIPATNTWSSSSNTHAAVLPSLQGGDCDFAFAIYSSSNLEKLDSNASLTAFPSRPFSSSSFSSSCGTLSEADTAARAPPWPSKIPKKEAGVLSPSLLSFFISFISTVLIRSEGRRGEG